MRRALALSSGCRTTLVAKLQPCKVSVAVPSPRLVACSAYSAAPRRPNPRREAPPFTDLADGPTSSSSAGGYQQRREFDNEQGDYSNGGYTNAGRGGYSQQRNGGGSDGGGGYYGNPEFGQQGQQQQQEQNGQGQYRRPRRNNYGGGGGYRDGGEGGDQPRRQWYGGNDNLRQQSQQQQQQGGQGQWYSNRERGRGGGGGTTGSWDEGQQQQQQGGQMRQQWRSSRQGLTSEQLALREQINLALRQAEGWRAQAAVLADKGQFMDAENICSIFQKVSKNRRPQDPQEAAEFDQLLSTLLGWVLSMAPTFRPRQTSSSFAALARLQLYSPEVVTALLDQAARQLGNFNTYELCTVVASCAKLGSTPTPSFMQELMAWTETRLQQLEIMELVQLLDGLLTLKALPTEGNWITTALACLEKQCLKMPEGQRSKRDREQQGEQPAAAAATATSRDGTSPAAEVPTRPQRQGYNRNSAWGSGYRDPYELMLSDYQELCMLLANLANTAGLQVPQSLVDVVFSRQLWRVYAPPLDFASRLLWAVSNLQARPSRQWFETLMTGLASRNSFWDPTEIGTMCLYLSRYLQQPATPIFSSKLSKFIEGRKIEMGVESVASCLYLLAMSGFKPQERWLDDMLIWLKAALPTCSASGLELIYNALPFLGSGFRLNEVVSEAAQRYNAAQPQQAGAEAGGGPVEQQQEPAAAAVA